MPQQADAAPHSRPGACGGASFPPLITAQSPRGNGRAQNAHRLLRQAAYYYRPADCADYFGDMAKAAGEAALYTVQVCGGASLASIQADDGAACAAYIESRAADVGALGHRRRSKVAPAARPAHGAPCAPPLAEGSGGCDKASIAPLLSAPRPKAAGRARNAHRDLQRTPSPLPC